MRAPPAGACTARHGKRGAVRSVLVERRDETSGHPGMSETSSICIHVSWF
jgi:hypothetical protein